MQDKIDLIYKGKIYKFPIVEGSENEPAIDIKTLRAQTGLITLDPGFKNTGSCKSEVTFLNGEEGILRYRGYSIEDLANNYSFIEVAYLLIFGDLPTAEQLNKFEDEIRDYALVDEDFKIILKSFPKSAHPMGILSSLTSALIAFNPSSVDINSEKEFHEAIIMLLAKFPVLASWTHRKMKGLPLNYPNYELPYTENLAYMMFKMPNKEFKPSPSLVSAFNKLLILHADHEQNCSTSTVRMVGSSHAGLFPSIASGISALWGPLHGGANQAVIEMLEEIKKGTFREDLYYRLNVFPLATSNLMDRKSDIIPLTTALLFRHCKSLDMLPWLNKSALKTLLNHNWPGNVRELENIVQRALVLCEEKEICSTDIVIDNNPLNVSTNSLLDENTQQLAI